MGNFEECWGKKQEEVCKSEAGDWAMCVQEEEEEDEVHPDPRQECLHRARQCFSTGGVYVWGKCYRAVLTCIHPVTLPEKEEEEHHHHHQDEEHEDHEHDCSYYMDHCFDYNDAEACSTMFDVCFVKEETEEEEEHHGEEERQPSCVESVRYCLEEGAEEGKCLNLILYCTQDYLVEEIPGCYHRVSHFLEEHSYDLELCRDLVEECGAQEEHYTQEDCYSNAEQCLETEHGSQHPVCLSLISYCYSLQETRTCLADMELCLTQDLLPNSSCHHQLGICLKKEEQAEHYEEILKAEDHWAKVVRLLLAKNG